MINIFEKDLKIPFLLDAYGALLTERKREMMEYYYNEDYSLAEISEVTGISRQGVRDSIRKTVAELHELESRLHMAEKMQYFESCTDRISKELYSVIEICVDETVKNKLTGILRALIEMNNQEMPGDDGKRE